MAQAARPFASNVAGKMGYEDFVWFILSEEDKSSDLSLEYWFRCCDLDCDGCLRSHEMLVGPDSGRAAGVAVGLWAAHSVRRGRRKGCQRSALAAG